MCRCHVSCWTSTMSVTGHAFDMKCRCYNSTKEDLNFELKVKMNIIFLRLPQVNQNKLLKQNLNY